MCGEKMVAKTVFHNNFKEIVNHWKTCVEGEDDHVEKVIYLHCKETRYFIK
jgi:hypothetical protein